MSGAEEGSLPENDRPPSAPDGDEPSSMVPEERSTAVSGDDSSSTGSAPEPLKAAEEETESQSFFQRWAWVLRGSPERRIQLFVVLLSVVLLELGIGLIATVLQRVGETMVTENLEAVLGAHRLSLVLSSRLESIANIAPVLSHAVSTGLITRNYTTGKSTDGVLDRTRDAFLAAGITVGAAERDEFWAGFCGMDNYFVAIESLGGDYVFTAPFDTPVNESAGYSGRCHVTVPAQFDKPWSEQIQDLRPNNSQCASGGAKPGCWWSEIGDGSIPEDVPVPKSLCNYYAPGRPWFISSNASFAKAAAADTTPVSDKRWGHYTWSTPYVTTSFQYVMSVMAPVFDDQTTWDLSMMCGVDLDFRIVYRALRAYLADRNAEQSSNILLVNQEGTVLIASGPSMEDVPFPDMATMNVLDGTDMSKFSDLSNVAPAMRKKFGTILPAKGSSTWSPGGRVTQVVSWFEGDQFYSISPLDAQLDGSQDCYVLLTAPRSTYRVGIDSAVLRTVVIGVVVGVLIALVEGLSLLQAQVKEAVHWATTFRIGPQVFRYERVVGLWLVVLGFVATFGVWLEYTEQQTAAVVRDGAVGFGNLVSVRTAAFLFSPALLTEFNSVPFQTGLLQPVPATQQEYDELDNYLSTQHSIFESFRFIGVATRTSYHGTLRLMGKGNDPSLMEVASVDPEQVPGQWLFAPLERKSPFVVARNLSATPVKGSTGVVIEDTSWYSAATSNATEKWSRAYTFVDGAAGITAVRDVPPSEEQKAAPLGVVVEVSPDTDGVSKFLSISTEGSDSSRIFVVERVAGGTLVGTSHGEAAVKVDGVSSLQLPTDAADPTTAYLTRALLSRFGSLDKVPCPLWQGIVGEEAPDRDNMGQFFVSYKCIEKANWGVLAAFRSDQLQSTQRTAMRQSIILVVGLVGVIFGSLLAARQYISQRRAAAGEEAANEGAEEEKIISNDEVAEASEANVTAERGRLLTRLRHQMRTNLRAVYGDREGGIDLVQVATRLSLTQTSFGIDMEAQLQLQAKLGSGHLGWWVVRLVSSSNYRLAAIVLSSLHCVTALWQTLEPPTWLLALDGFLIFARTLHIALLTTSVFLQGRYVRSNVSQQRLLLFRSVGVLALLVDFLYRVAMGTEYGESVSVTAWLRPVLLGVETQKSMSAFLSFLCTVLVSQSVFLLFAVFLFVAAVLSVALFPDQPSLNQLFNAIFSMFSFMSTADNYQDMIESTANSDPGVYARNMAYFGTFSAVGFFVFISLVVAVFQETFVTAHQALSDMDRTRQNTPLMAAFLVMTHGHEDLKAMRAESEGRTKAGNGAARDASEAGKDGAPGSSQETEVAEGAVLPMRFALFFLEKRRPELKLRAEAWVKRRSKLTFEEFDEMVHQVDNLVMPREMMERVDAVGDGTSTQVVGKAWVGWRRWAALFAQHPSRNTFIGASCVLLGWMLAAQRVFAAANASTVGDVFCFIVFLLHVIEVGVRVLAMGPRLYFAVPNDTLATLENLLEATVMGVAFVAMAVVQASNGAVLPLSSGPSALRFVFAAPLLRSFLTHKGTRILLLSILRVLSIYGEHVVIILQFALIYACLSPLILGGAFRYEHSAEFDVSLVNFDDPLSSLITLFQVSLQAGWSEVVTVTAAVRGEWVRWYFVAYVFVQGILLLNLFAGVLCDAFASVDDCRAAASARAGRITQHVMINLLEGRDEPKLKVWVDATSHRLFVVSAKSYDALARALTLTEGDGNDGDSDDKGSGNAKGTSISQLRREAIAAAVDWSTTAEGNGADDRAAEEDGGDEDEIPSQQQQAYTAYKKFVARVEAADFGVRALAEAQGMPLSSNVELLPEIPPSLAAALEGRAPESEEEGEEQKEGGDEMMMSSEDAGEAEEAFLGRVSAWAERRLDATRSIAQALNEHLTSAAGQRVVTSRRR